MNKAPAPITVERGDVLEQIIFKGSRKPMSRRDLHVALEPIFRRWLQAVSGWTTPSSATTSSWSSRSRSLPETEVYVQFWSEPFEPVRWEVSSGTWNPPADEWLDGERARRIEALGFQIGGRAGNYARLVDMKRATGIAAVAKEVVEVFYGGFDYRGTRPIHARLAHDGRSEMHRTFDAFTPEDVGKVFAGLGFVVEEPVDQADDGATAVIRCRSCTMVELDGLGPFRLFARQTAAFVFLPTAARAGVVAALASMACVSVAQPPIRIRLQATPPSLTSARTRSTRSSSSGPRCTSALPAWTRSLPAWTSSLPGWTRSLPAWTRSLPVWTSGWPAWTGGLARVDERFAHVDRRLDGVDDRLVRIERKLDQFIDTQARANDLAERRLRRLESRA